MTHQWKVKRIKRDKYFPLKFIALRQGRAEWESSLLKLFDPLKHHVLILRLDRNVFLLYRHVIPKYDTWFYE